MNPADILFGAFLVAASVTWLAAGRPTDDRASRQRHPSSRPLTPPGAAAAPPPPRGYDRGAGRTS